MRNTMDDDLDLLQYARNFIEASRQQLAQEEDPVMRKGQRQRLARLEAKSDDELRTWAARLILAANSLTKAEIETASSEDLGGGVASRLVAFLERPPPVRQLELC